MMCLEYLDNGCARKLDDVLDSVLWFTSVVPKLLSLENKEGR